MLTCDDTIELIGPAVEEALTSAQAAQVEEHLRQCSRCRAIETQRRVRAVLSTRAEGGLPAGFEARLFARLDAERRFDWLEVVNWRTWSMCLLPAAALVLAIAAGIGRSAQADRTVTDSLARMLAEGSVADTLFERGGDGERWMDEALFGRDRRLNGRSAR